MCDVCDVCVRGGTCECVPSQLREGEELGLLLARYEIGAGVDLGLVAQILLRTLGHPQEAEVRQSRCEMTSVRRQSHDHHSAHRLTRLREDVYQRGGTER